jgi:hypothetical protein
MLSKGVSGAVAGDGRGGLGGEKLATTELGSDATWGTGKPPDIRFEICKRQASAR